MSKTEQFVQTFPQAHHIQLLSSRIAAATCSFASLYDGTQTKTDGLWCSSRVFIFMIQKFIIINIFRRLWNYTHLRCSLAEPTISHAHGDLEPLSSFSHTANTKRCALRRPASHRTSAVARTTESSATRRHFAFVFFSLWLLFWLFGAHRVLSFHANKKNNHIETKATTMMIKATCIHIHGFCSATCEMCTKHIGGRQRKPK